MIKIVGLARDAYKELKKEGLENANIIDRYKGYLSEYKELVTVQLPEDVSIEYHNIFYADIVLRQKGHTYIVLMDAFERIEIS